MSVTSGSTSAASGQVTGPPTAAVELVDLLDQVDRAVDATVLPATSAEGVSREGWRVLLLLAVAAAWARSPSARASRHLPPPGL